MLERIGLVWLAAGCIGLGLLPTQVIKSLRIVVEQLSHVAMPPQTAPWWLLVPLPQSQATYSAIIFLAAIVAVVLCTVIGVRLLYHRRVRRAPPWDCGFARLDARMQDTAEGFGQPIRHIFQPFFGMQRELPSPFDRAPRYRVTVERPHLARPVRAVELAGAASGGRFRLAAAGTHRDVPPV